MANKYTRIFTPEEAEVILKEGAARNQGKEHLHHWYNNKDPNHLLKINALGVAGEIALQEILPGSVRNDSISMRGDGGIDVIWRGWNFDAKTTTWEKGGHLYWEILHRPTKTKKKPPTSDILVLIRRITFKWDKRACVRVSGWLSVPEFWEIGEKRYWPKSQCDVHLVASSNLRTMKTIYDLPQKGMVQEGLGL